MKAVVQNAALNREILQVKGIEELYIRCVDTAYSNLAAFCLQVPMLCPLEFWRIF